MYKVLSFDLFVTLADLSARVPTLWERIFERDLTSEEVERYAEGLKRHYLPNYYELYRRPFTPMETVFRQGFADYFSAEGFQADPERATRIFLEEHNRCPIYPDAAELLRRAEGKYRIVISTDADVSMVSDLLKRIPHEKAFVSEEMRVYKANREGAFFRRVAEETGVLPGEILHIGDGQSDVIGAKCYGMDVYHVDRDGQGLPETVRERPDYTGRDLTELYPILNL